MVRSFVAVVCVALVCGPKPHTATGRACPPAAITPATVEVPSDQPPQDVEPGDEMAQLRRALRHIRELQSRIRHELEDSRRVWCGPSDTRFPELGWQPEVRLVKGDKVVLRHKIEWRQYPEDDLEVTVTASDPSLKVPATLKLNFEKHQFRFEYEVAAGDKAGKFEVTLTPTAGKAVTVRVVVK